MPESSRRAMSYDAVPLTYIQRTNVLILTTNKEMDVLGKETLPVVVRRRVIPVVTWTTLGVEVNQGHANSADAIFAIDQARSSVVPLVHKIY